MTQNEAIIQFMKEHGSITPMDAFSQLGITKLATRIGEIRKAGKKVIKNLVCTENRYGKTIRYMRYSLGE